MNIATGNKMKTVMMQQLASDPFAAQRQQMNECRFHHHDKGHYESYFLRANHPDRPLAFWIRYTIFAPRNQPEHNRGELWAVVFNGETAQTQAAKMEIPLARCHFDNSSLNVRIGDAMLQPGLSQGEIKQRHHIQWQLRYQAGAEPLLLLPEKFYERAFPKAKALVANPNALFSGHLVVNGETINVDCWQGSENHNWGSQHTDEYAWGQVAGFDDAPDSFLEVATARLRLGGWRTPAMTTLVLRLGDRTLAMNSLWRAPLINAHYGYFHWHFDATRRGLRIVGDIQARREQFVGLKYDNPPGGSHVCLNCKIAKARIVVHEKGKPLRELHSNQRAAFEILTDNMEHGVPVVA